MKKINAGFTLIELLTTLSIAAVLGMIATPHFSAMLQDYRIKTATRLLQADLTLARSEAIKTRQTAMLCQSSDGQHCDNTLQWQQGWLLFIDANDNSQHDANEAIVHRASAIPYVRINAANFLHKISYYADGRSNNNGTFNLCNTSGTAALLFSRSLIIAKTGRARMDKTAHYCG